MKTNKNVNMVIRRLKIKYINDLLETYRRYNIIKVSKFQDLDINTPYNINYLNEYLETIEKYVELQIG